MKTLPDEKREKLMSLISEIDPQTVADASAADEKPKPARSAGPVLRWIMIAAAAILLVGVMFTASVLGNIAWKKYHPASSSGSVTSSDTVVTEAPGTTLGPEATTAPDEQTTPEPVYNPDLPKPGQTVNVVTSTGSFVYGMNDTQTGWIVECRQLNPDLTEIVLGEPHLGIPVYEIASVRPETEPKQPVHVIIHPDVQKIGPNAFNGSTWMEILTFSKNLKSIDVQAFANNYTLKRVEWDECGLEAVGHDIFAGSPYCYHEHVPRAQPIKQEVDCLGHPTMLAVCRLCLETYTFVDTTVQEQPTDRHVWVTVNPVSPTCITSGCYGRYCSLCGKDECTLPPLGHDFDANGNCTRCRVSTTGLAFLLNEDGESYTCCGCANNFTGTELIVPSEFQGKPVTDLYFSKYYKRVASGDWYCGFLSEEVTHLVIPSTVKRIQSSMLGEFDNITSVVLPEGLEYIGYNVLEYASITELVIPSTVKKIEKFAFACCNSLQKLDIRCKDAEIAEGAFLGVELYDRMTGYDGPLGLEWGVSLEGHIVYIAGLGTFQGTVLDIPDYYHGERVYNTYGNVFTGNTTLEELTLPGTLSYAQWTNGLSSLAGCTALKKVVLREIVCERYGFDLDPAFFDGCSALETLILPMQISTIGENAFRGCTSLKEITYLGTREQWQAIMDLGKFYNSKTYRLYDCMETMPAGMTVRCSDGDIVY